MRSKILNNLFFGILLTGLSLQSAFAVNWDSGFDKGKFPANQVTPDCSQWSKNLSCADGDQQAVDDVVDQLGGGSGTVTSIATTSPITGGTITSSGTIGINTTGPWNGQAVTVSTINGLITNGSNITISGSGTSASPYSIASSGGGGGSNYWNLSQGNVGIDTFFPVGIGTVAPSGSLNVIGNVGIGTFQTLNTLQVNGELNVGTGNLIYPGSGTTMLGSGNSYDVSYPATDTNDFVEGQGNLLGYYSQDNFIVGFSNNIQAFAATVIGSSNTNGPSLGIEAGGGNACSGTYDVCLGAYNTATNNGDNSIGYAQYVEANYSTALGYGAIVYEPYSFALGIDNEINGGSSGEDIALGSNIYDQADFTITIGIGVSAYGANSLINNITGSIMMGSNSNIPTLMITQSAGVNTIGNVGIGTVAPSQNLEIASGGYIAMFDSGGNRWHCRPAPTTGVFTCTAG